MNKVLDIRGAAGKYPALAAELRCLCWRPGLSAKELLSLATQVLSHGRPTIDGRVPCEGDGRNKKTSSGLAVVAYSDALRPWSGCINSFMTTSPSNGSRRRDHHGMGS